MQPASARAGGPGVGHMSLQQQGAEFGLLLIQIAIVVDASASHSYPVGKSAQGCYLLISAAVAGRAWWPSLPVLLALRVDWPASAALPPWARTTTTTL